MFLVPLSLLALAAPPALRSLDLAVARSPRDAGIRIHRAVALELAGERDEALADWQVVADLQPTDHRPHLHRARLLAALHRPEAADEAVERAAELTCRILTKPSADPPPPTPQTDLLTGAEVPSLSLTLPKPVAPTQPALPVIWYPDDVLIARADRLIAAANWCNAIPVLAELAARRPADAAVQVRHGRALLAWAEYKLAEAAFDTALILSPDDLDARAGRAYSRAARNLPTDGPLPPAAQAHQRLHAGDTEAALVYALLALSDEPGSCDLIGLTARLAMATDRPMLAVLVLSTGAGRPLPDTLRAELLDARAEAWMKAGSLPAAERDADRATTLAPFAPEPEFIRGLIAETRQDYKVAADCYTASLTRQPFSPATFRLAMLRASAPDPAVRDGEAAIKLADKLPDGFPVFGLRAIGHAEAGRYARAVAEVNAALAANPPDDQREQFLRMRAKFLADRPWRGDADAD